MTLRRRLAIAAIALVLVVALAWTALAATVYAAGGVATVTVREQGMPVALTIPVPVGAIRAANGVALTWGGEAVEIEFGRELGSEVGAALAVAERALGVVQSAGEFTLVEVEDGDTDVRIRSESGQLEISVREPDTDVRVSVPIRGVRLLLADLALATGS